VNSSSAVKEEPQRSQIMQSQHAIIASFDTHDQAESAVKELERSGFDLRQLSIVGKGYHSEEHPVGFYTRGDRMLSWGSVGAFWGALWGLLVGAAFFWIPGFGPIAAAGPFVHMLVTGVEGAAVVGGLGVVGAALANLGVPKKSIIKYESQLRANKYLLIAHGRTDEVETARRVLERTAATETELFKPDQGGEA
jgi:hypothetical protein